MSTSAQAVALLAQAMGCSPDAVPQDSAPGQTEGWDSLAHMNLVLAIEGLLSRELSADEIVSIGGIQDIVALLDTSDA